MSKKPTTAAADFAEAERKPNEVPDSDKAPAADPAPAIDHTYAVRELNGMRKLALDEAGLAAKRARDYQASAQSCADQATKHRRQADDFEAAIAALGGDVDAYAEPQL